MSPKRSDQQLTLDFTARSAPSGRFGVNLTLALAALGLLVSYIFLSNQIVARRYALQAQRGQLAGANAALEAANNANAAKYSLEYLTAFAKRLGLVEVKDAGAIFAQSGVALENAVAR